MPVIRNPNNRYIKRKCILFFLLITLFLTTFILIFINLFFNSGNVSTNSDIKNETSNLIINPKLSAGEITIQNPKNITYTEPMDGYYPATYSFDNDEIGSEPAGWFDTSQTGCSATVIASRSGHEKVLQLSDQSPNFARTYTTFTGQETGIISFYWQIQFDNKYSWIVIYDEDVGEAFKFHSNTENRLYYHDDSGSHFFTTINGGSWYYFAIEFNSSSGWSFWFNNNKIVSDTGFINTPTAIDKLYFSTENAGAFKIYIDAVLFSWDPNYNKAANKEEGLLLSFENSTNLDWIGYSLDGQANKTILGDTTITMPKGGSHKIQIFGNDSLGNLYASNIRFFSTGMLRQITPKNITYTDPMIGYYPSTYGFENDKIDAPPKNWILDESGGSIKCRSSWQDHSNVLEFYDYDNGNSVSAKQYFSSNQIAGIVEFWMGIDDISYCQFNFSLYDENDVLLSYPVVFNDDCISYRDGNSLIDALKHSINTWYHFKVIFDCSDGIGGQYDLYINNNLIDTDINFIEGGSGSIAYIQLSTHQSKFFYRGYFDAIGYSWHENYNEGDNNNEGLLISFRNYTYLDWIGYSLDGQHNKTISGNTTIPMPDNGLHTIQIFANDSIGKMYNISCFFTVNIQEPSNPGPLVINGDDDDGDNDDEVIEMSFFFLILLLIIISIIFVGVFAYIISQKSKEKPTKQKKMGKKREKFIICPYCFHKVKKIEEFCAYCGSPLTKEAEDKISKKLVSEEPISRFQPSIEKFYDNIFLQSSNILKIWIFNAKDKKKIYEETLDPSFSDIEQNYIDLSEILKKNYDKNIFIKKIIQIKNINFFLYIYWANNPVIFIFVSGKKFDKDYLDFIENTIKEIDLRYKELSIDSVKFRKFLDESMFLYNSRIFGDIPLSYREYIREIFKNKDEMELVFEDLKHLPNETFLEFLILYKKLTAELLFEKTRYTINNHNFFIEGFE